MRDWCETRAAQILSHNGLIVGEPCQPREGVLERCNKLLACFSRTRQRLTTSPRDVTFQRPVCWVPARHGRRSALRNCSMAGRRRPSRPRRLSTLERAFSTSWQSFSAMMMRSASRSMTSYGGKARSLRAAKKAKSVRDSRLVPVRAVLGWGANNRKLPQNVAERVAIDVKSKPSERRRGYTDEEAALLLRDARLQKSAHRRWVPWLCAYAGARVSEICQLRVEDVRKVEGIWSLHITADAGSVKNAASERLVPVHSAILSEGFLDFVRSRKSGPLLTELKPDRFGNRGGNGTKVLGRWVRDLGVVDARISPNHSWRHRFKTLARRHGLATDVVDAMVGHQRRTVADSYGEFPASALQWEFENPPPL